ncbi:hypothetical protein JYU34_005483 [Plutella xylostella]|uniref:RNA-directed DNA polymerase n=1 Tax=Plutella xylostella TaxID=51655 RepID=A0ABQ7QWS9_PLUXY|nr:hypothetical protein JYU34_005483 [Plutella xylostella]
MPFYYSDEDSNSYITIPARCEYVLYIDTIKNEPSVVISQELCDGVYIANSLVTPENNKIPIRLLNTRETEVKLSNIQVQLNKLNDYHICHFTKPNINSDRVKLLFSMLNLKGLGIEEQKSIENICAKFPDIFHLPGDKLCTTPVYQHSIEIKPDTRPVYTRPYRLPHSQKEEINKQVESMLKDGIIEEAKSPWNSPLLLVPKKQDAVTGQKKWRVVIDYRKLNNHIQDDKFPLPHISDILDSLSGAVYFSHLDLYQGFYQGDLKPSSRPYTAFTTDKNQYQMTRIPMGLKSSPNSFSRMMTIAMSGLNFDKCLVYQDDLVVFGQNLHSHNRNLLDIFGRLRQVNLKLNPIKCNFLQKEILYLGHIVSEKGIEPDPEKTKVLANYPRPQNADETKRFVAFTNYYRKFIPQFASIASPLNKLCCKNTPFIWSDECEKSFLKLKNALTSYPVLQYPNLSKSNEFILQTDASGKAIGSVLCNHNGKPVAYASRSLNKAELNYPTIEKELLAIVWSVKHFRPYLYGRKFKIQTDHRPLVYLFGMRDPSSRLLKFRLQLEEYDFVIEYVKGKDNTVADALSRITITSEDLKTMNEQLNVMTRAQTKKVEELKQTGNDLVNNSVQDSRPDQPRVVDIIKKPKHFTELSLISKRKQRYLEEKGSIRLQSKYFAYAPNTSSIYLCTTSRSSISLDELVRDLCDLCRKIKVKNVCILKKDNNEEFIAGIIEEINKFKKWSGPTISIISKVKRLNNLDDRRVVLNDFHLLPTSGHAGIRRMSNNIKKFYFWPNMDKDICDYVSKCTQCQKQKYSINTKQPTVITSTADTAMEKVYLDIVGPLPVDDRGFIYILTLQCDLSKFVEAYPLKAKDTVSVAQAFVQNFILKFGIPREVVSDRGTEFVSNVMKEVCKILEIKQLTSTAYHHQTIGALENTHKTLGAYLRIYCQNYAKAWSSWVPYWCFAYNNTVHSETEYTPYELVFGKKCILPSNLSGNTVEPLYNHDSYPHEMRFRLQVAQRDAKHNLEMSKIKRKIVSDKYINPVVYKKGEQLLIRNSSTDKTEPIYLGPYTVIEDLDCNVKILKNNKEDIVHKNRTKRFFSNT